MQEKFQELQNLYCVSSEAIRLCAIDETIALKYYEKYINFVYHSAPGSQSLLDVGCGTGWSSYLFSKLGYQTTGIDLNAKAFEPRELANLTFVEGSVLKLPFRNASFDVVATHQAIEHIPDPQTAILEMLRILKPNGTLCIVSPNLLSISMSIKAICIYVWKNRPLKTIFIRTVGMPRHPFGNTLPEVIITLLSNIRQSFIKTIDREAKFTLREPDLTPPFHGDNDACYLCNPIDFIRFLPTQNCIVVKNGYYGRMPLTQMLAGGTYIAAHKLN